MVFSSLPSYLDPPNWPQQQQQAAGGDAEHDINISQLLPPLLPPAPAPPTGSGQMSERARMVKLPPPETAMKCPRCDSTNTKFCYFNNYSLSQPRHFCKTCRRYWTRGGALRNVPVGGGCRRNKKSGKGSRSSRSKSPTTTRSSTSNTIISDQLGHHLSHNIPPSQFPISPSLHHYGGGDLGLTFGGGNGTDLIHLGHDSNYPSSKFAHFPFLEGTNGGMYGEGPSSYGGQVGGLKMEENHHSHHQGLNLSRNFMGISGNDQFLGTSNVAWSTTDLNGFTSSSTTTTHLL